MADSKPTASDRPVVTDAPGRARIGAGVLALVATYLIAAMTDASAALARPLWLDEVVTQLIASAPAGVIHAMRSGADFQPPPYYLLVRFADAITGTTTAAMARMPSVIAAALAIVVIGAILRARVSLPAALAGTLVLAAHPLFMSQAVEARPYALWIFATAITAESLRDGGRGRGWFMVVAAVALCTAHYFGVLALGSIGIAAIGYRRFALGDSWLAAIRFAAPLAAGGLALAALLPLAGDQLAATNGESWASRPTGDEIFAFLTFIWGWRPVLYLLAGGIIVLLARRVKFVAARLGAAEPVTLDAPTVALLATVAVPFLVVAISLTYKPLGALRYSVPALLGAAALCALAVQSFPRWARWAAVAFMVRAALISDQSLGRSSQAAIADFRNEQSVVGRLVARGVPVAAYSRHDAYQMSFAAPRKHPVAWFDAPDDVYEQAVRATNGAVTMPIFRVERGFGLAVRKEFDFPGGLSLAELRVKPVVALVRDIEAAATDTVWLPGRVACPITPRIVAYSVAAAVPACELLRSR